MKNKKISIKKMDRGRRREFIWVCKRFGSRPYRRMATPQVRRGKPRCDQKCIQWSGVLCHLWKREWESNRCHWTEIEGPHGYDRPWGRVWTGLLAGTAILGKRVHAGGRKGNSAPWIRRTWDEHHMVRILWGKSKIQKSAGKGRFRVPSYLRKCSRAFTEGSKNWSYKCNDKSALGGNKRRKVTILFVLHAMYEGIVKGPLKWYHFEI